MSRQDSDPIARLAQVLAEMQRIQAQVAADSQPVSMHELDALTRLGSEYAVLIAQLEADGAGRRELD